ncbi:hypothetical protein FIV42_25470 [Persicimonas caeni]|jgi:hypothetical protein|uniref:Uncharacterized protein n=1 Tax=Persicimonas caeni TaxID=2292766 RepID=A0A4Y6Q0K1_PERCE|nr:hypothetical protein [Persicimonas caeni]QDG53969.1 hypothetical protein FIV42_25470 [Persicimonas caeni]QED35190.1 hypothetical protein FRD00_25465 [Persicimonas caeni]
MKSVITSRDNGTFNIGQTPAGRAAAAMERFVFIFPLIVLGGSIFFLPDYIGRYREQEPMPGFLFLALVLTALFIGLVASTLRFFRNDLWVVDAGEGMLVYQASRVFGKGFEQAGIELDMVERFIVNIEDAPRDSEIFVRVDGHGTERVISSRFGVESVREAADELKAFLDDKGIDIPVIVEQK